MEHPFRTRVAQDNVLLADGAMGTELYARGIGFDHCFDAQNLERPDLVEDIHRDYITAGAEIIETNTFGANRMRLGTFGLEDKVRDINQRGARIARGAREICGVPVFVAGSVGPTGKALEPFGQTTEPEIYDVFCEQIEALLEGGIDLLVLETFGDLREILQAVQAARNSADLPIIAQMTFTEDIATPQGYVPEQVVDALQSLGVDVVGANCSVGPSSLLEVVKRLLAAGAKRVSAMPNAGWPTRVGERVLYLSSADYMADYGKRMADIGASVVGGCCGTTPTFIRALHTRLQSPETEAAAHDVAPVLEVISAEPEQVDVSAVLPNLGKHRIISVEIRPPRGANPSKAVEGARLVKEAGADAVNVLDSAMARVRMSAISTAILIKQRVGVETILHFTTRDRNLMAIQSDLIGAHAMGVRAVLALTGDPPALGDYARSKAVYDVDSIGLIRIIKQLNAGVDVSGNSIGTPTSFLVGAALNPTAEDLDLEMRRFTDKVRAGADFAMTQPVYDAALFERVLRDIGPIDIPILMGVLPLQSYRHALFLHNELPGVRLTHDALRRMESAGTDGIAEGMCMAEELVEACGDLAAGLYIMPSFGRYEMAAQLVSRLLVPA